MQIQSLYQVFTTLSDSRTARGKRFNQAGVLVAGHPRADLPAEQSAADQRLDRSL